jgi:hypothetical protein
VLVEGRVGIIKGNDGTANSYTEALKKVGASGAIVGGGLAVESEDAQERLKSLLKTS